MSVPDRQLRRATDAAVTLNALGQHRRRCRVCRKAQNTGQGLCETGRQLLYAAQAALRLTTQR